MKSVRGFLVNCAYLLSLFREFQADLRAQKQRAILTTFGIVWGTAAVVIMMSVGTSVKRQNMINMRGLGDAVVLLFPGSTTRPYQGFGVDFEEEFVPADIGSCDDGREVFYTAVSAYLSKDLLHFRSLDEDGGGNDVPDRSSDLSEQHIHFIESALDLGPGIAGIETLALLVDGRGSGDLDQRGVVFCDCGGTREGGSVSESLFLCRIQDAVGPDAVLG